MPKGERRGIRSVDGRLAVLRCPQSVRDGFSIFARK